MTVYSLTGVGSRRRNFITRDHHHLLKIKVANLYKTQRLQNFVIAAHTTDREYTIFIQSILAIDAVLIGPVYFFKFHQSLSN